MFPPLLDWTFSPSSRFVPVCPADGAMLAVRGFRVSLSDLYTCCRISTAWHCWLWCTDVFEMQELKQNIQTLTLNESQTCLFSSSLFLSHSSRRRRGCWLSSSTASYRGLRSGQLTAPSSSSSCSCHWGSSGVWFGSPDGPATPPSAWNTQEGRLHYIMPAHHMTPCSQTPPPSCCYTHCTCSAVVLQTYKGHAGLWPFINHLLQLSVFVLMVPALKLPCQGERHHIH